MGNIGNIAKQVLYAESMNEHDIRTAIERIDAAIFGNVDRYEDSIPPGETKIMFERYDDGSVKSFTSYEHGSSFELDKYDQDASTYKYLEAEKGQLSDHDVLVSSAHNFRDVENKATFTFARDKSRTKSDELMDRMILTVKDKDADIELMHSMVGNSLVSKNYKCHNMSHDRMYYIRKNYEDNIKSNDLLNACNDADMYLKATHYDRTVGLQVFRDIQPYILQTASEESAKLCSDPDFVADVMNSKFWKMSSENYDMNMSGLVVMMSESNIFNDAKSLAKIKSSVEDKHMFNDLIECTNGMGLNAKDVINSNSFSMYYSKFEDDRKREANDKAIQNMLNGKGDEFSDLGE